MKTGLLALIVAGLTVTGTVVYAQPAPRPMPGPQSDHYENPDIDDPATSPGDVPSAKKWEDVRKKMEAVRMWRLTEALKLDEKTSSKLAALLGSIDQQRVALMRKKAGIINDLRLFLHAEKRDQKKIRDAVDTIGKIQDEMLELRKKETKGIRDLLTVEQQAQYLVFQNEFQREMRGMIAGARGQGRGPGKGTRGGMGAGPNNPVRPPQQ